jgi:hypothetical protein
MINFVKMIHPDGGPIILTGQGDLFGVLGIGYWVLGTGYWVLGIGYWVLCTRYCSQHPDGQDDLGLGPTPSSWLGDMYARLREVQAACEMNFIAERSRI